MIVKSKDLTPALDLYKPMMKGLMHRKTGVRELIDEWRSEGIKEADAFGEGWRQNNKSE